MFFGSELTFMIWLMGFAYDQLVRASDSVDYFARKICRRLSAAGSRDSPFRIAAQTRDSPVTGYGEQERGWEHRLEKSRLGESKTVVMTATLHKYHSAFTY